MLPLKIKALNGCCSDESNDSHDEPVKITKEALVSDFFIHLNIISIKN